MASVKPDVPTDEEVSRIRQYLESRKEAYCQYGGTMQCRTALRDYALFLLLLTTGRRIGELLSIKVENIDWDKHLIWSIVEKLKKNVDPKLKNAPLGIKLQRGIIELRPISVPDDVMKVLFEYVQAWRLKEGQALFPYSSRWAQKQVKVWANAVGIHGKIITPHSFRHYLITKLREQGWVYEDISKITGHKSIKSLQETYDHTDFWTVKDRFSQVQEKLVRHK